MTVPIVSQVRIHKIRYLAWLSPLLLLLLLFPLRDERPEAAEGAYDRALQLFEQGNLTSSQAEAEAGWEQYQRSDVAWAEKFQLLEAKSLLYRHFYEDALRVLTSYPAYGETEEIAEKLAIEAVALTREEQLDAAEERLRRVEAICAKHQFVSCGDALTARGILAQRLGDVQKERQSYLAAYSFARTHRDTWREANSALNLSYMALQDDRYDEAINWSSSTYATAERLGYGDAAEGAAGNLGWAYYQLGDGERALERFLEAEKAAEREGDASDELNWLSTAAYVYRDQGDLARAKMLEVKSLAVARKINSREKVTNVLGDLASLAITAGNEKEADTRLREAWQMETAGGHSPRPVFTLMEGELALERHQLAQAGQCFHAVLAHRASPMAVRLNAGNDLGQLYEETKQYGPAERTYKATIDAWEAARAGLKREESALSFGANATEIYDHYISLLVREGRTAEALAVADRSRARTLAEGLGIDEKHLDGRSELLHPEVIARKAGATLLFYWLGEDESYLWAITPQKTVFFKLPAAKEIATQVERYNRAMQQSRDGEPDPAVNPDGLALYAELVKPAAKALAAEAGKRPVIVLSDGALSGLNFETLLVPESGPAQSASAKLGSPRTDFHPWGGKPHYLIEGWTLLSAPSLDLLAHGASESVTRAASADPVARNLLLIGNPVSADPDFPPLPLFGAEMRRVQSHFGAQGAAAIEGAKATPAAYAAANPGSFAYIHFVSHATASRTAPLDSAIILSNPAQSNPAAGGDPVSAYKLYAREIVAHPLKARLVTISACYGSGTRAYAGEGLIGLSWAFLRAGARQVVSALWEVSDESTPRLMDGLYAGIQAGKTPAAALRDAKLTLLNSGTRFRQPFYWAPFQIYSRE